jgi:hypothetical protein
MSVKYPASNTKGWLFLKWYASTRHKPTAKYAVTIPSLRKKF